jgi:hypothetical protein
VVLVVDADGVDVIDLLKLSLPVKDLEVVENS